MPAGLLAPMVIGLHLATAHVGEPANAHLQGATPGVYVRTAAGLTAGFYRNSHDRNSVYVGWTCSTADDRWALTAGVVTGYPRASVYPLLVPSVRVPLGTDSRWSARLAYLPKPHSDGAHGLHLSLEKAL